jgi:hypothetical protein
MIAQTSGERYLSCHPGPWPVPRLHDPGQGRGRLRRLGPGFPLVFRRFRRHGSLMKFCLPGLFPEVLGNLHGLGGEIAGAYVADGTILFNLDLSPIFDLPQLLHFGIQRQGGGFRAIQAGTGAQIKMIDGHIKTGAHRPGQRRRPKRWRRRWRRRFTNVRLTACQADDQP